MAATDMRGGSYEESWPPQAAGRDAGDYHVCPGTWACLRWSGSGKPITTCRKPCTADAMKLYLKGHDYKYAAEQMLLTLFPGERPSYPDRPAGEGEDSLTLSLSLGGRWATARAVLPGWAPLDRRRPGPSARPGRRAGGSGTGCYQRVVKNAFYRAGVQALGRSRPGAGSLRVGGQAALPARWSRAPTAGSRPPAAGPVPGLRPPAGAGSGLRPGHPGRQAHAGAGGRLPLCGRPLRAPPGAPTAPLSPPTWGAPSRSWSPMWTPCAGKSPPRCGRPAGRQADQVVYIGGGTPHQP
jgi:hypothetical protein